MISTLAFLAILLSAAATPRQAAPLPAGLYDAPHGVLYVGVEHELPDRAANDFFDPGTQRTGNLGSTRGLRLQRGISEERHAIATSQGRLGFSLYYATARPRATIVLIHGNDPETREMGWIVPFFVLDGVNVVSYDQRGVGVSAGNWFFNGPAQRAADVSAIYDAIQGNPHVDPRRIGVWGFSNGGWTAPLATLQRPMAFMILKSAPTKSLVSNIDYEVKETMLRHGEDAAAIARATALWHVVEAALNGTVPWTTVRRDYDDAAKQPWFKYSLVPDLGLSFPPPPAMVAGLRRFVTYDPVNVLRKTTVPTLALYGILDRKVDAVDSAAHLRQYLAQAGNHDVTIAVYQHAGHQLIVSKTGYGDDAERPERYVPGYPHVTIAWLTKRGYIR